MKKIIIYTLLLLWVVAGCGPKFVPLAKDGATIDDEMRSISLKKDGITVKASIAYLNITPYDLESYLTPFRLEVRNETGSEINVDYKDFILLDGKGNQFRPYSPEKIAEIIKSDPEYAVKPPTVAITLPNMNNYTSPSFPPPYPYGYDYYPYGDPYYDYSLRHWTYPPSVYERYRRDQPGETLMQNIYLDSLPMGEVVDGAQVSGNIYFNADLGRMKSFKIRAQVAGVIIELPFAVK